VDMKVRELKRSDAVDRTFWIWLQKPAYPCMWAVGTANQDPGK